MPNRRIFLMALGVSIGVTLAMPALRLAASRWSTHEGAMGTLGDAINAAI